MKKPEKGWKTPNAWLLWKMGGWTLEEIKYAFLALIPSIPGGVITLLWNSAMQNDGYYGPLVVPPIDGELDVDDGEA